jgi:hypothetical protein
MIMRKNVTGLLGQFGFGVQNDLLALVICLSGVAVVIVLALAGLL